MQNFQVNSKKEKATTQFLWSGTLFSFENKETKYVIAITKIYLQLIKEKLQCVAEYLDEILLNMVWYKEDGVSTCLL